MGLSKEQSYALHVIFDLSQNAFITGCGGTGKSYLIERIRAKCQKKNVTVGVTALTGIAAWNVGGQTIHSWAGIGLGKKDVKFYVDKIKKKPYHLVRWKSCEILVIDEVSMLTEKLFSLLDQVARQIRKRPHEFFGGIQLVLVGDFLQLPPVKDDEGYLFESKIFQANVPERIELVKPFRQKDPKFYEILCSIRKGEIRPEQAAVLMTRVGATFDGDIQPTKLFSTNVQTNCENMMQLKKLDAPEHHFPVVYEPQPAAFLFDSCPAVDDLTLKVGAQVMLTVNKAQEQGLVNGSRGIVREFKDDNILVEFATGQTVFIDKYSWTQDYRRGHAYCHQYPLRLAYASTIHKGQGLSLDLAEVDAGGTIFADGQAYVALSRVRTLEGLSLAEFTPESVKANPKALDFYRTLEADAQKQKVLKYCAQRRRNAVEPQSKKIKIA